MKLLLMASCVAILGACGGSRTDYCASRQPLEFTTTDEAYAELARRVPGFGGYFLQQGLAYAHFKDPTPQAAVLFVAEMAAIGWEAPAFVVPIRGDYDWLELLSVKETFLANFASAPEGAVMFDVDELKNRFTIGLATADECGPAADEAAFARWLSELQVDTKAVNLVWTGRVRVR